MKFKEAAANMTANLTAIYDATASARDFRWSVPALPETEEEWQEYLDAQDPGERRARVEQLLNEEH